MGQRGHLDPFAWANGADFISSPHQPRRSSLSFRQPWKIRAPGEGFLGTASAEGEDGKHDMKRAPAAITSLSAASRCASRLPSDPSVQSPRNGTRSEMTGFSRIYKPLSSNRAIKGFLELPGLSR